MDAHSGPVGEIRRSQGCDRDDGSRECRGGAEAAPPRQTVAAAQWGVRGHEEDLAFRRKPSRPTEILKGGFSRALKKHILARRAPPHKDEGALGGSA